MLLNFAVLILIALYLVSLFLLKAQEKMKRRTFLKNAVALVALGEGLLSNNQSSMAGTVGLGPFLEPWTGKYNGYPRFDLVKASGVKEAMLKGMELKRAEIKAITDNTSAADFANTIAALEDSGRPLGRSMRFFEIYTSTMSDKAMQALESEMKPKLAQFDDEIVQNDTLFKRIQAVSESAKKAGLAGEKQRLTDLYLTHFKRQGAGLDADKKKRLREINEKLASLYASFHHNQLGDEEDNYLLIEKEEDLAGLSDNLKAAAATQAESRGKAGKWLIANTRSSMEPFLTFATKRDLREKGWRMWTSRGDNKDKHDNKKNITEIVKLRAERAKLLGYPTYAHWSVADSMAQTPDAAMKLMMMVWRSAVERVHQEVDDMQKIADSEGAKIKIEPWDYRYYGEKVRIAKYDIDQNEVKQYLQLDLIRDGMFFAAGKVYGIEMVKVEGLPVVHPDVTVYEVRRKNKQIGLWYFDPYAREGKSSGAWMSEYRTQERFKDDVTPVVSNNSNFVKGKPGEPVLISWDDANTMFHEFGHALHGLLSNVTYPSLAGTSVKRDFVEFPSQVNERWFMTDEVLSKFALHYQSKKPIPKELVAKLIKAKTFHSGFHTVEYLASALYDMKIHLAATPDKDIDPAQFERDTMAQIGCPSQIVMRHRPTAFGHIFSDDGYAAGYYAYIWADTMSADAAECFKEAGGFYDRKTCDRFADTIFSVGNSVAPDVAFKNFRGRAVDTNALMRDRGFPVVKG